MARDASSANPPAPPPDSAEPPFAWQPLTPRGVAAFAFATWTRLLVVQTAFALLTALAVGWFLAVAWFPTVREAIHRLPDQGVVRAGELKSPRASPEPLAQSGFLSFAVNLENQPSASPMADLQLEFQRHFVEVRSLLGALLLRYPKGYEVQFNRPELAPWWGAWQPILVVMAGLAVVAGLLLLWALLAALYAPVSWLVGFFADRAVSLAGSWRLAAAALLPGALVMVVAIFAYGLEVLQLLHFLILTAFHVIIPWVYLMASPLALPPVAKGPRRGANPFAAPDSPPDTPEGGGPFARS
jgi:hypothetical protein